MSRAWPGRNRPCWPEPTTSSRRSPDDSSDREFPTDACRLRRHRRAGHGETTATPFPARGRRTTGTGGDEAGGDGSAPIASVETPSSSPPSIEPKGPSGHGGLRHRLGGRVRAHRLRHRRRRPGPRSDACSTWPSPGPEGPSSALGRVGARRSTVEWSSASRHLGWRERPPRRSPWAAKVVGREWTAVASRIAGLRAELHGNR